MTSWLLPLPTAEEVATQTWPLPLPNPPVRRPDFQKLLLEEKKTPREASLTSALDSWEPHCPPCGSCESEAMAEGKSVLWNHPASTAGPRQPPNPNPTTQTPTTSLL